MILRSLLIAATPYLTLPHTNHRSLLQNIVSLIGLFCKRDLSFQVIHVIAATRQISRKQEIWIKRITTAGDFPPRSGPNHRSHACVGPVRSGSSHFVIQSSSVSGMCVCIHMYMYKTNYGVATMSMLLKITSLFCRISSVLQGSFAKETYNLKEPNNRSHHIYVHQTSLCNDRFLLQNIVSFIGLFCKRDLSF